MAKAMDEILKKKQEDMQKENTAQTTVPSMGGEIQKNTELSKRYALLGDREAQDYAKYRDMVSDWQTERDRLQSLYDSERDFDYGKYADERDFAYGTYADERDYAYNEYRDQIADEMWQAEFDEMKRQYEEQMASSSSPGLANVGSMTSAQLVETMSNYKVNGDLTGLRNFLADCVDSGRLSLEAAEAYYNSYAGEELPDTSSALDTTVDRLSGITKPSAVNNVTESDRKKKAAMISFG